MIAQQTLTKHPKKESHDGSFLIINRKTNPVKTLLLFLKDNTPDTAAQRSSGIQAAAETAAQSNGQK